MWCSQRCDWGLKVELIVKGEECEDRVKDLTGLRPPGCTFADSDGQGKAQGKAGAVERQPGICQQGGRLHECARQATVFAGPSSCTKLGGLGVSIWVFWMIVA